MYDKYAKIRDKLGYTDYAVAKACGIGKSSFSDWKSGRSSFSVERLEQIAGFLGVSICDFFEDNNAELLDNLFSDDEKDLVNAYRLASDDTKAGIRLILGLKK